MILKGLQLILRQNNKKIRFRGQKYVKLTLRSIFRVKSLKKHVFSMSSTQGRGLHFKAIFEHRPISILKYQFMICKKHIIYRKREKNLRQDKVIRYFNQTPIWRL